MVTRELIDSAISARSDTLWHYGILLVVLSLVQRLLNSLTGYLRIGANATLQKKLQGQLMNELLSREYAGLRKYHSGELVSRVFSDVSVVKGGILGILPRLCNMLVSFVGAIIILGEMDRRLVIALLVISLLGSGMMLLFRGPMKTRHKRMQEAESRLQASIQ